MGIEERPPPAVLRVRLLGGNGERERWSDGVQSRADWKSVLRGRAAPLCGRQWRGIQGSASPWLRPGRSRERMPVTGEGLMLFGSWFVGGSECRVSGGGREGRSKGRAVGFGGGTSAPQRSTAVGRGG